MCIRQHHGSRWLKARLAGRVLLGCLALVSCAQQHSTPTPAAPPTAAAATGVPTAFASTAHQCLGELGITSPDLDLPEGLILRQVQVQGMGLSTRQYLRDVTVSGSGLVRDVQWWFFPDPAEPAATPSADRVFPLKGRFEPETCVAWTIPPSLIAQLEAALSQPDFRDLRPADVQPAQTCPDYGGYVLIAISGSTRKELYVTECPAENTIVGGITGILQQAFAYAPPP